MLGVYKASDYFLVFHKEAEIMPKSMNHTHPNEYRRKLLSPFFSMAAIPRGAAHRCEKGVQLVEDSDNRPVVCDCDCT
jgi:hypothetical protein